MAHRVSGLVVGALSLCIMCGCDWPWRHDMADQPSRPAAAGPRSAVSGTLPMDGAFALDRNAADALVSPIAPSHGTATGRVLYSIYCEPCHGNAGMGNGPIAKYYLPMRDLTSAEVQQHSDGWLYATIASGTEKMPRYSHELSGIERWEIVHFVRSLGAAR